MLYLDTSAALKLVVPEPETAGLELWIAQRAGVPRVSSRLLRIELWRIELLRVVSRQAPQRANRAHVVLSAVALLSMDEAVPTGEAIGDSMLRSFDAIHLATAYGIRDTGYGIRDTDQRDRLHLL
jgi:predicted nucleic acid-binding protein